MTETISPVDLCADVLAGVVDSVPYSSASQFYEYFGDRPAAAVFGVSCAWQSFLVGARLAARGGPAVSYLVDGRHVAVVVRGAGELIVLDPYLMHREPLVLNLNSVGRNQTVAVTAPALPIRIAADGTPRPGRVRAVWRPAESQLRLEYSRYSPTLDRYVPSRFFSLDTERELAVVPPPAEIIRPLLLHPEQNNVSVRAVDPQGLQVRELIYPLTGTNRGRQVTPDGLVARDNQGALSTAGSDSFRIVLSELAAGLEVGVPEVVDFVLGAAEIYRQIADPSLELPAYRMESE